MNVELTRENCLKIIYNKEVEQIVHAAITHFAIPAIMEYSMDNLTQTQFEAIGGIGLKPEPISEDGKREIYTRLRMILKPVLHKLVTKKILSELRQKLAGLTNAELDARAQKLKDKVFSEAPDWTLVNDLFRDHLCLFTRLHQNSSLDMATLRKMHDLTCGQMNQKADHGLFDMIKIRDIS